jgi:copper homeostasis protein
VTRELDTRDSRPIRVELCVDSGAGARVAREAGADRIELCAALELGGLTPSEGLLAQALEEFGKPVVVLLRPRAGDFVYDRSELRTIERDLDTALRLGPHGVTGVAVGVLTRDGEIDVAAMDRILDRARPLEVTFHRAVDLCRDPLRALDALLALGIDRVLSSGGAPNVEAGESRLKEMVERAGDRIAVMPGGGVTPENAARILAATGAREIHGSAGEWFNGIAAEHSALEFRARAPSDAAYRRTSPARAAEFVRRARDGF